MFRKFKGYHPSQTLVYKYLHSGIRKARENEYARCKKGAGNSQLAAGTAISQSYGKIRLPTKFSGLMPNAA